MRWIGYVSPPRPNVGDVRVRSEFLFFPRQIGTEVRWWEYAKWKEKLTSLGSVGESYDCWTPVEWLNLEGVEYET